MQSKNQKKPSRDILNAVKVVLVSGSLVGAVGIWGAISNKSLQSVMTDLDNTNEDTSNTFIPLPTLADVVVAVPVQSAIAQVSQPTQVAAPDLRNINALPTPTMNNVQPTIQTVYIGSASAGTNSGGGSKSSKSKPAATTRTS